MDLKNEREADELVLLTKCFVAYVEKQYKNNCINEQEYEVLIGNKRNFIHSMGEHLVYQSI